LAYNLRTASTEVIAAAKENNAKKTGAVKAAEPKSITAWAHEVIKNRRIGETTCEFL